MANYYNCCIFLFLNYLLLSVVIIFLSRIFLKKGLRIRKKGRIESRRQLLFLGICAKVIQNLQKRIIFKEIQLKLHACYPNITLGSLSKTPANQWRKYRSCHPRQAEWRSVARGTQITGRKVCCSVFL